MAKFAPLAGEIRWAVRAFCLLSQSRAFTFKTAVVAQNDQIYQPQNANNHDFIAIVPCHSLIVGAVLRSSDSSPMLAGLMNL